MDRRHFLDKGRARFLAGLVGVLALTGLAFTWHKHESTDAAGRNLAGVQSPAGTTTLAALPTRSFASARTSAPPISARCSAMA
jgi:hypothetical protein